MYSLEAIYKSSVGAKQQERIDFKYFVYHSERFVEVPKYEFRLSFPQCFRITRRCLWAAYAELECTWQEGEA